MMFVVQRLVSHIGVDGCSESVLVEVVVVVVVVSCAGGMVRF